MKYSWAANLYAKDGDNYENCLLVFIGENTIVKFKDVIELEGFANKILSSLKEIRENT